MLRCIATAFFAAACLALASSSAVGQDVPEASQQPLPAAPPVPPADAKPPATSTPKSASPAASTSGETTTESPAASATPSTGNAAGTPDAHALPEVEVIQKAEPEDKQPVAAKTPKKTTQPPPIAAAVKSKPVKKVTPASKPVAEPAAGAMPPEPSTQPAQGQETTAVSPVQGYVAARSASGSKTDTPIREVPQAISVVGREQMQDQGAQSIQETLRYVPGVVADLYGVDSRNDGFAIRGQETTVQFLDGLRRSYGNYLNAGRIETYTLERIEVLKGPSSVLYGQSGVGGTINMVSKRPQDEQRGEVGFQYGSYDAKQAVFDMTGPVTTDKTWLYRVTGLVREAGTQVDFVDDDRYLLAPSLTYRPDSNTSVTLLGQVSRDRTGSTSQFLPHEGTLFAGPNGRIPRSRFVGEPDMDRYDVDAWSVTVLADHKFDETWSVHQAVRYAETDIVYSQIFPFLPDRFEPFLDPERRTIARDLSFSDNHTKTFTSDSNAVTKFDIGQTAHKVLAGFDYSRAKFSRVRDTGVTDCGTFDLYDPVYGQFEPCDFDLNPLGEVPLETLPDRVQWQAGLYLQDQIRLGPWIAVLGLRKDWTATETVGAADEKADALTKRAGLMYELPFGLTPYVSYAESFVPTAGSDFFDRPFQPLQGESIEAGFKYQAPGTSFVINSAVFDATEQNRLAEDPDHPGFSVQSAEVRLRGFEIEAKGNLTDEIKLIAGYSYLDARHTAGDQAGFKVESLPRHVASLWAIYTFQEGGFKGFSFGGGIRYNGSSWDGFDQVETPSFTLFDAMLSYETERWTWTLNATNLEDEYHLTTCLNRGDCFIGAGREITTGLTYKF